MSLSAAQLAMNAEFEASDEKSLSVLVFSLGKELYGATLQSTREVIRLGEVKSAPYMVPYFKGVINLRGQIVSVIDLRTKFGIEPEHNSENLVLIVEHPHGLLGAVVDHLISVEKIHKDGLEQKVALETKIPADFFMGVAKVKERLVNIVDIAGCLSADELRMTSSKVEGGSL